MPKFIIDIKNGFVLGIPRMESFIFLLIFALILAMFTGGMSYILKQTCFTLKHCGGYNHMTTVTNPINLEQWNQNH